MKKKLLKVPKAEEKTFEIDDFRPYSQISFNMQIGKKLKAVNQTVSMFAYGKSTYLSGYMVNNRLLFYSNDKYIYELVKSLHEKRDYCESKPILIPITLEGKEEILVVNSTSAFILEKSEKQFSIPMGSCFANYDNRLFIADGTTLYFGGEFDLINNSMNITDIGHISISSQDGSIVDLVPYEDYLLIFCESGISKLKISTTNDFTINKLNMPKLEIREKSIKKIGNEIFFISQNKLNVYKNGKVEMLNLFFDEFITNKTNIASTYKEYYAITYNCATKNFLFMFNTISREAHVLDGQIGELIGENCIFNKTTRNLYKIKTDSYSSNIYWNSFNMDFGTNQIKSITSLDINTNAGGTLYLYSDLGSIRLQLKTVANYRKLNFHGRYFRFYYEPLYKNLDLENLRIRYKIIGD